MKAVGTHPSGATLAVRAKPAAKKNAVLGLEGEAVRINVTAPPEDGRANDAIVELLRDWLGLKRSQIELVSGQRHRCKVFLLHGMSAADLEARVLQLG